MFAVDNTNTNVQPLPSINYFDICVVGDNPWRRLFHTGTAGTTSDRFCAERLSSGATYQFLRLTGKTIVVIHTPQKDINAIIELMKPSMSQLASAFRVSRQRIYDWRNGEGMSEANAELVRNLLGAARTLSERSSNPDQIANRKVVNGRNFWSSIAAGLSPQEAAEMALKVIEREQDEREAIKRSLASRKVASAKAPSLFSAYLSE